MGIRDHREDAVHVRDLAAFLACGLLLAPPASAEVYHLLRGSLTDAETGEVEALTGAFEASLFDSGQTLETLRAVLRVDDFKLESGGRTFLPRGPIEYDGLTPALFLEIANQINLLEDDRVGLVFLRSGGEIVAESEDEVSFRFLELRSGGGGGTSRSAGQLGQGGPPRRLDLHGSLYEFDQRFAILSVEDCTLAPAPISPGGGGIGGGGIQIGAGGNLVHFHDSLDIDPDEVVEFVPPDGGALTIRRVSSGAPSAIDGELVANGSVVLVNPTPLVLDPTTSALAPTLDELGILAPSGAQVTYDDSGALTVTTEGDLIIEDLSIDLPGLTSVTLLAGGSITVTGSVTTPPGVDLNLESGEFPDGPGDIIVTPHPVCHGLRPIFVRGPRDVGRKLGTFSLVATAAQPAEIDVWPGSGANRVMPGFRRQIPVALLGAPDFDVRDVNLRSLRFGPGDASAQRQPRFLAARRRDVNRDGIRDLVAWFSTREAEIAYGETTACLHGERFDGAPFEGCDAIDTRPTWMHRPRRGFRPSNVGPNDLLE
jgi:filamentous hemagglutinin family protein